MAGLRAHVGGRSSRMRSGPQVTLTRLPVLVCLFAFSLMPSVAQADEWLPPANISRSEVDSLSPVVLEGLQSDVIVLWAEMNTIWLRQRTTGGWMPSNKIVRDATNITKLSAVLGRDGDIHVLWLNGNSEIQYSRSDDLVIGTEPMVASGYGYASWPDLDIDAGGTLHAVWPETTDPQQLDGWEIYYGRLNSDDVAWPEPINISHSHTLSRRPSIAVDSDERIHVVWSEEDDVGVNKELGDDVYWAFSADGGRSWSEAVNLSRSEGSSGLPQLMADNEGQIHLVYVDHGGERTGDPYTMELHDLTWSSPRLILDTAGLSTHPALAVDGDGYIYIAWQAAFRGNQEILYTFSADAGQSWSPFVNISQTEAESRTPDIAATTDGLVDVVWTDNTSGSFDVYHATNRPPLPVVATSAPTSTPSPVITISPSPTAFPTATSPAPEPTIAPTMAMSTIVTPNVGLGDPNRSGYLSLIGAIGAAVLLFGATLALAARRRW